MFHDNETMDHFFATPDAIRSIPCPPNRCFIVRLWTMVEPHGGRRVAAKDPRHFVKGLHVGCASIIDEVSTPRPIRLLYRR